ncbi:MAG: hypothetical protein WD153_00290 [Candidatus Paceibacterota bacterium]
MSDEKEKTKQTKDRSVAYPGVPLNEAIDFTAKLRDALGKGPYSRDEAARALGHSKLTGPASRKVAALVHYGLLERSGNTYSQSQLSQDILKPMSDELKNEAIRKAAVRPKLFQKLCQRFGGQALPSMLQNILIRERVSEGAANDVVRIFTETMKFAELLVNGVLTKPTIEDEDDGATEARPASPTSKSPARTTSTSSSPANRVVESADDFVFEFTGGIRLLIPRTNKTSEAIADGELKETRNALSAFASNHMKEDVIPKEDTSLENENV